MDGFLPVALCSSTHHNIHQLYSNMAQGMFGTSQHATRRARALALLNAYVGQINRECHTGAIESLEELELSGGIATNELDRFSAMMHGVDGAAASRQGSVEAADALLSRLNDHRSDRVALLLTDFPDLHWLVLVALSVSIVMAFLLESNQLADQYLNSIQLRSLFALLVGVISATAVLCLDLDDVFRGSFSIAKASTQIGDLQLCLQEDVREANAEAGEVSPAARGWFRELLGGPTEGGGASNSTILVMRRALPNEQAIPEKEGSSRYSVPRTIYFHLLTSPIGASVRALGEVAVWISKIVTKRGRAFLSWVQKRHEQ